MEKSMDFYVWLLLTVIISNNGILGASTPNDSTYYAGVVEFAPSRVGTPKQRVSVNRQNIISIIESNATTDLDILVFPEMVLNNKDLKTYVPDPAKKISPCDSPDYDFFLSEISCSVRSKRIYVVINLVEKEICNPLVPREGGCGENGINTFNTNVVFDRDGRVISRYRKTHLYGSEWYSTNVLATPELAAFRTDFGVTFGHFICFDMLFYMPAMRLVKEYQVTDIIYPTYWFSELPFLTAVQLQEGWAFANNVNLLAADASVPSGQNTGSGIYAGRMGRLVATIHETPNTVVLKALVPKRSEIPSDAKPYVLPPHRIALFSPEESMPRLTNLSLLRDYNLDIFTTEALPIDGKRFSKRICHDDFCCEFNIEREYIIDPEIRGEPENNTPEQNNTYQYRVGVYSGNRTTFQRVDRSALKICALFACTGSGLHTCGHIFPYSTDVIYRQYFQNISISASFPEASHRLIMPSTVDGMIMPLSVDTYEWSEQADGIGGTSVGIKLTYPKTDLLTFGIWANYYTTETSTHNLDIMPIYPKSKFGVRIAGPSNGSIIKSASAVLLLVTCLTNFINPIISQS